MVPLWLHLTELSELPSHLLWHTLSRRSLHRGFSLHTDSSVYVATRRFIVNNGLTTPAKIQLQGS